MDSKVGKIRCETRVHNLSRSHPPAKTSLRPVESFFAPSLPSETMVDDMKPTAGAKKEGFIAEKERASCFIWRVLRRRSPFVRSAGLRACVPANGSAAENVGYRPERESGGCSSKRSRIRLRVRMRGDHSSGGGEIPGDLRRAARKARGVTLRSSRKTLVK